MPVPCTQEIRRPLLDALSGGNPHNFRINDYMELIAEHFGQHVEVMSLHDRNEL